jgi:hypothetical protein
MNRGAPQRQRLPEPLTGFTDKTEWRQRQD